MDFFEYFQILVLGSLLSAVLATTHCIVGSSMNVCFRDGPFSLDHLRFVINARRNVRTTDPHVTLQNLVRLVYLSLGLVVQNAHYFQNDAISLRPSLMIVIANCLVAVIILGRYGFEIIRIQVIQNFTYSSNIYKLGIGHQHY